MALSCPQKRTARRVASYERLWFGKSIIRSNRLPPGGNSDRNWNQHRSAIKPGLERSDDLGQFPFNLTINAHQTNLSDVRSIASDISIDFSFTRLRRFVRCTQCRQL